VPFSGLLCSPETGQSCYVFTHPAAVPMTRFDVSSIPIDTNRATGMGGWQDTDVAVLLQRCRNAESSSMRHEEHVRAAAEEAA
jgi:hypothetical protein